MVNTHFPATLYFKNYRLQKQFQEYSNHISGKIPIWAERMDVQMKTTTFKPSDPISVLSYHDTLKTAYDINSNYKGTALWLFGHFIREPVNVSLATLSDSRQQKEPPTKRRPHYLLPRA